MKTDIEMKFWRIVNGLICGFKTEHCPYLREGESSILGTLELKKSLKIDIFVSLCDKRAGKQKI